MKQNTWTVILTAIAFCIMGLLVGCADAIPENPDDVDEVSEEADGDSDDGNTPISFTRIDFETDGDGDGTDGDGDETGGDGDGDETGGDGDGDDTGGDGDGDDTGGDGDGDDTGGDGDGDETGGDGDGDETGGDGDGDDTGGAGDGDDTGGDGDGDGTDGDGDGDGTDGDGDGDGDGDDTGGDGDGDDTGGDDDDPVSCVDYDGDIDDGELVDPLGQGFWRNHPEQWPYEIDSCYAYLCGVTFMELLETPADPGDAWIILSYQYAAAVLNADSGVEACGLEELLAEAQDLLLACSIDEETRDRALEIGVLLDDFNSGEGDPGSCE